MAVLYYPPTLNGLQKTLDAKLDAAHTTAMTLNNVTGVQNEPGVVVINRIDADGNEKSASVREYVAYTGTSGSTLTGLTRNVDSSTSDQDHAVGSVVEFICDVSWGQSVITALASLVDPDDISSFQDLTSAVTASTATASGKVELATAAETTTGTDATRAVTPDGLAGSDYGKRVIGILVFDDATEVSTGNGAGDVFVRIPSVMNGWNLVDVEAQNQTAATGTGTQTTDIQIYNVTQAADMLSTKLTIDEDETDSSTAAAAAVIDTNNDDVATGDQIRIDVDAVPSTTGGNGLYVELTFQLP